MSRAVRITNILVVVIPFVAFVAALATLWNEFVGPLDLAIGFGMYAITLLGVTIGFHRYLTHHAFQTSKPVEYTFAILGSMAIEGPVVNWVADHRKHHAHTDQEATRTHRTASAPACSAPSRACGTRTSAGCGRTTAWPSASRYAPDLIEDRGIRIINLASARSQRCPGAAVPPRLGDRRLAARRADGVPLGRARARLPAAPRHVVDQLDLPLLRPPALRHDDQSTNVFWLALPSFGEAWHHNHHAFPRSAFHGLRKREIDLAGWVIMASWRSSGSCGTSCGSRGTPGRSREQPADLSRETRRSSAKVASATVEPVKDAHASEPSPHPARRHRRLPHHGRDPPRRHRRRGARPARPSPRRRVRQRRHDRPRRRARPAARRRPRRDARGRRPRRRRRRAHRPRRQPARRGRRAPRRRPCRRPHPRARARVPRGRRGDPRAARRRRPRRGVPALDLRARRAGRHLRLLPRPDLRAEGPAARGARRHRPPGARARSSSASAWPSCRSAARSARTSSPAPRSSSASTSCASRWSRSAASSARTTARSSTSTARRSKRPACPTTCASRPSASSTASSAWARAAPARAR